MYKLLPVCLLAGAVVATTHGDLDGSADGTADWETREKCIKGQYSVGYCEHILNQEADRLDAKAQEIEQEIVKRESEGRSASDTFKTMYLRFKAGSKRSRARAYRSRVRSAYEWKGGNTVHYNIGYEDYNPHG